MFSDLKRYFLPSQVNSYHLITKQTESFSLLPIGNEMPIGEGDTSVLETKMRIAPVLQDYQLHLTCLSSQETDHKAYLLPFGGSAGNKHAIFA